MANITYLLGAGASANALPVINEITERLGYFKSEIDAFHRKHINSDQFKGHIFPAQRLISDLDWLIRETGAHQTIDTFARKLFAQDSSHHDLKKLKKLLSVYFLFEQLPINGVIRRQSGINQPKETPDKRYDSLIASLLKTEVNNPDLLENVKILSWNYDVQFELSYRNFWGKDSLFDTHEKLQIIPGRWLQNFNRQELIDLNKFSLIHLNGVAGYYNILKDNKKTIIDKYFNTPYTYDQVVADIVEFFDTLERPEDHNSLDQETVSYLNYAWEYFADKHDFKSPFANKTMENAERIAQETDVLVIIGYSFPIFNRQIDKKIIEGMHKLQKVYIQDRFPENIYTIIRNAFALFQSRAFDDRYPQNKGKYVLVDSINQFVLPYEL